MLGKAMQIENVVLKPFNEEQLISLVPFFMDDEVTRYTMMQHSPTDEQEATWFTKVSTDPDSYMWGIFVEGRLIGFTSLHRKNSFKFSTGIIIADKEMWGQGIGTNAHIARTFYAATRCHVHKIATTVLAPNTRSLEALVNVGYVVTGMEPRAEFRDGVFYDMYLLSWFNPTYVNILYPEGVPAKYEEAVEQAKIALEVARHSVKFGTF